MIETEFLDIYMIFSNICHMAFYLFFLQFQHLLLQYHQNNFLILYNMSCDDIFLIVVQYIYKHFLYPFVV